METYKLTIEFLSALAALVAIIGVLFSWFRSAQKPLKVERVVIHQKDKESKYILVVKNRKDYPVRIESIHCYKHPTYRVQKKSGGKPEYSKTLSSTHALCFSNEKFEIAPGGNTDIRFKCSTFPEGTPKVLFSMQTSHGYHEIWCRDILEVEVGKTETYFQHYEYNYQSRLKAEVKFLWVKIRDIFIPKK